MRVTNQMTDYLGIIYDRLLNKYQKQETLPEIPTTERVIKSTRNYIESIYVLQQM